MNGGDVKVIREICVFIIRFIGLWLLAEFKYNDMGIARAASLL